jgi:hypothetical protein
MHSCLLSPFPTNPSNAASSRSSETILSEQTRNRFAGTFPASKFFFSNEYVEVFFGIALQKYLFIVTNGIEKAGYRYRQEFRIQPIGRNQVS